MHGRVQILVTFHRKIQNIVFSLQSINFLYGSKILGTIYFSTALRLHQTVLKCLSLSYTLTKALSLSNFIEFPHSHSPTHNTSNMGGETSSIFREGKIHRMNYNMMKSIVDSIILSYISRYHSHTS